MPKDSLNEVIKDVPEEQQRLLERMIKLKLVRRFGWNETTRVGVVVFTAKGKQFLNLVRRVSAADPSRNVARLLALDILADGKLVFGGFPHERLKL
jgi:hypothetical protein